MLGLIFASSLIIFLLVIPLYFLFPTDVNTQYTLLGIQIIFSFYITVNLIEFLAQPNYAASSLLGNTLGFVLSAVVYLAITSGISPEDISSRLLFFVLPPVIGYTLTIAGLGVRDAIYYKFFERGNNPFYLPSLKELRAERQEEEIQKEKENEEVNVELK
jgi:hypothetical protein